MEPKHVFLKSVDLDDENNFKIELTKNNKVEEVKIKKNYKYLLTNLTISPKIPDCSELTINQKNNNDVTIF